jgi:hypothetical protein
MPVFAHGSPHADPDPSSPFNADQLPDPAFHFHADPDPAPHQSDANLRSLVNRTSRAPILSFRASIVSVHGPPQLYFEPLTLIRKTKDEKGLAFFKGLLLGLLL